MCASLAAVFAQRYSEQAVGDRPVPNTRMEGTEQYLLDSIRKGDCQLTAQTFLQVRDALAARLNQRRHGLPYQPGHTARTLDDDYAAWAVGEWERYCIARTMRANIIRLPPTIAPYGIRDRLFWRQRFSREPAAAKRSQSGG